MTTNDFEFNQFTNRAVLVFVMMICILVWGSPVYAENSQYAECSVALHAAKEQATIVAFISQSDLALLSQKTQQRIEILAVLNMARQDAGEKCAAFIKAKR